MSIDLDLLRRAIDDTRIAPFASFPDVLAIVTTRDYTQTPAYEVPVLRAVTKLTEMQWAGGKP